MYGTKEKQNRNKKELITWERRAEPSQEALLCPSGQTHTPRVPSRNGRKEENVDFTDVLASARLNRLYMVFDGCTQVFAVPWSHPPPPPLSPSISPHTQHTPLIRTQPLTFSCLTESNECCLKGLE